MVLSTLEVRGVWSVALVLLVFGWPAMVRLQRASVLEASAREYVTAARALGATPRRVLVLRAQTRLAQAPHLVIPALFLVGVVSSLVLLGRGLRRAG